MNVAQLYSKLSFGKLSNLSLAGDGDGTIAAAAKPRVLLAINEALTRLYTRYILKENDLLLELVEHITNYHLLAKFAESRFETSPQPFLYIKDLLREPFTEDVVRILSVTDSYGCTLPLNDTEQIESVFTPQGNLLQVPHPVAGLALAVLYQANHPTLVQETDEVVIPTVLEGALLSATAYEVYANINTAEAQATAQGHLNRYESICQDVIDKDLVSTSLSTTSNRFEKRGWI